MNLFFTKPTLDILNKLVKILPADWHKFGVEYKSIIKDSSGFVTGGQLEDGRRFTYDQLNKSYQFTR